METTLRYITETGRVVLMRFPAHFEVCDRCGGTGHHVNPAIDGHGLGSEDFDDEDFREAYFGGRYDVTCYECKGERVVAVVNEDRLNPWQQRKLALWERQQDGIAAMRREEAMERAFGA